MLCCQMCLFYFGRDSRVSVVYLEHVVSFTEKYGNAMGSHLFAQISWVVFDSVKYTVAED